MVTIPAMVELHDPTALAQDGGKNASTLSMIPQEMSEEIAKIPSRKNFCAPVAFRA